MTWPFHTKGETLLTTSLKSSEPFLESKRLFIDSCVLVDWTKDPGVRMAMHAAQLTYNLAFASISLLEVGFGPMEKIKEREYDMARAIYHHENINRCSAMQFALYDANGHAPSPGTVFSVNPGHEEWLMARNILIDAMNDTGLRSTRIDKRRNDALFFATAHNTRSALITNNLKDFKILNKYFAAGAHAKLLPVFSVQDLWRSLSGEVVSFPENLVALQASGN